MAKHAKDVLGFATLRRRARGEETPITFPWASLTKATGGGLFPGLYGIVGGTGIGKTQMVLELLHHAGLLNHPSLYIGLEMSPTDLSARLLGFHSGRPWSDYIQGAVTPEELESDIATHWGKVVGLPLLTEFASPNGWPYSQMVGEVRDLLDTFPKQIAAGKTPLVVLDYLQLVSGQPGEKTREKIGRAAYIGRSLASSYSAVIILISSTSRENYATLQGKKNDEGFRPWEDDPNLLVGMGKESGDLEYAVDGLFVMVSQPKSENVWVGPAKFRLGKPGWVGLHFNGYRMLEGVKSGRPPKSKNEDEARGKILTALSTGCPLSPGAFVAVSGLGSGDAASLRAKMIHEGALQLEGQNVLLSAAHRAE